MHANWLRPFKHPKGMSREKIEDLVAADLVMDLPEGQTGRNPEDYLIKLRESQYFLIHTTQDYLRKHQRKRAVDGGLKKLEVTNLSAGNYVLLTYPNCPPNKLAGMVITTIDRPDLVKVGDPIIDACKLVETVQEPQGHVKRKDRGLGCCGPG